LRRSEPIVSAARGRRTEVNGQGVDTRDGGSCGPVQLFVVNLYLRDAVEVALPLLRDLQSGGGGERGSETVLLTSSLNSRSVVKKVVQAMSQSGMKVLVETSGDIAKNSGFFSAPPPAPVFTHGKNLAAAPVEPSSSSPEERKKAVATGGDEIFEAGDAPTIRVQTYHSFKGMEGDNVFVFNPGRLFPLSRALFVALTRARKNLYIFQDQRSVSEEHIEYLQNRCRPEDLDVHLLRHPTLRPAVPITLPLPSLQASCCGDRDGDPSHFRDGNVESEASSAPTEVKSQPAREEAKVEPVPVQRKRWRRQIHSKAVANFFGFMDIDYIQRLLSLVQSRTVCPPVFPVDAMYCRGLWEEAGLGGQGHTPPPPRAAHPPQQGTEVEASVVEGSSKEADTGAFIKFCDRQGPGTLGILGDVVLLVLHVFFFGELPQEYSSFAARAAAQESRRPLLFQHVQTNVRQVEGTNCFWERLRTVLFQIQDLAQLHVDFVSDRGFEDASVLRFDPVCCVHATVFRRIEGAALLFLERLVGTSSLDSCPALPLQREEMVFWRESSVRMPESAPFKFMSAQAFFGVRGQKVFLLQSTIKTDASEDVLEAAFTAVAFECEKTEIINVIELSVQEVSLRNGALDAEQQFAFVSDVLEAKTAARVEYTDEEFVSRILAPY
jgi:hypothetical protein